MRTMLIETPPGISGLWPPVRRPQNWETIWATGWLNWKALSFRDGDSY